MHGEIRPQRERLLKVRGRKGVVNDNERIMRMRKFRDPGDVENLQIGVGGSLDHHHPRPVGQRRLDTGEVGHIDERGPDPIPLQHPHEQPVRASIDVVGAEDAIAGVEKVGDGRDRRHARRKGQAVRGVLQRRQAGLQRGSRRICGPAVVVSLVHCRFGLRVRRGLIDRGHHRAGRRIRVLAIMNRAGLEPPACHQLC